MKSYYKWCMFFMSVIGLWPYSNKKFRLVHTGIISLLTWASVISQFVAIFAVDRNFFQLLRYISVAAVTMAVLIKYHTIWYQINDMKTYLDQVKLDWHTNNIEVLRIMQIYAFYGKRLVILLAAFVYPGLCIIILYHISPIILDEIVPLNVSGPKKFPINIDFLINEEQHPIFNAVLLYLLLIVDVTILVGTESFMIMRCLYIAGLFGIASHYFEKAILAEPVVSYLPQNCPNNETISSIATGVLVHRRALQYIHDLNEKAKALYSLLVILVIIITSTSLFCLSATVLQSSNIRETIFSLVVLFAAIGYMFWLNLSVEYVIDSASSISLTMYNTNWYETSIATQKLLQMIILKSNKSVSLNFFSIITPSIRNFVMFVRASISYFTVLLSL